MSYDPFAVRANVMGIKYHGLDLIAALERHQKAVDTRQNLNDVLTSTKVYLEEVGPIDLGGDVKVHSININENVVRVWIEDPENTMRVCIKNTEDLLGCKDIKEIVIRMLGG